VCALRGEITDEIGEHFLGLHELGIAAEFGLSSLCPQAPLQRQEERRGPKRSVDLNQCVFVNDWLAIYSTAMMSVVHLRVCSIMAS
jgi:hypothetical protein